jgi:hypothetical protein
MQLETWGQSEEGFSRWRFPHFVRPILKGVAAFGRDAHHSLDPFELVIFGELEE